MRALRHAILAMTLALPAVPASARIDDAVLTEPGVPMSAQEEAIRAAAIALATSKDPVEAIVVEGVRDAYFGDRFAPFWFQGATQRPQVAALRALMDHSADYGLDAALYRLPDSALAGSSASAIASADVAVSLAVARFVTHVASGRIRPTDISKLINLEPERPDVGALLAELSTSPDVVRDVASFEPTHPQYAALRQALKSLLAEPQQERIVVPEGKLLRPGMNDERVPVLRARLQVEAPQDATADTYDDALVEAVKLMQAEAELHVDGIVGPRTLLLLNGRSHDDDIASLQANLERWRWMPRELGATHVIVNVPEFVARVVNEGSVVHATRVVVGKPQSPTPTFSHVMSHIIINPYWNVPASIVRNEMVPEERRNPSYFARGGYEVFARVNGRFRQVSPYAVDWSRVNANAIQVRQVPGDQNALGRIKFMFPNQHSVYLHDTPSKRLFKRDERALSHGCVRVENPMQFADAILPFTAPDWNGKRLEKLYGSKERRVNLTTPIPVHLAYFTAAVDSDGTLRHFADIYGYDAKMSASEGY